MKIYVAHAQEFDYEHKLYEPLRTSALAQEHEFFLPHEPGNTFNTKAVLKEYDLLLAEVSVPSTGEGIELGRAEAASVPIVCLYEKGARYSSSLQYVTQDFIEYEQAADMLEKLEQYLRKVQP